MKEATGELNMTVIVLTLVGLLIALFFYTVWPMLRGNFVSETNCSKAICEPCPSIAGNTCKTRVCHMPGDEANTFECVNKG
ncbi:MAG: hypothetical protein IJN03_00220 [Bacilli bacterium]|nr:hypothetical protein [Bacilli bacterium]